MSRLSELLLRSVRVCSSSICCFMRLCPADEPSSIEKEVEAPSTFFFRWMLVKFATSVESDFESDSLTLSSLRRA